MGEIERESQYVVDRINFHHSLLFDSIRHAQSSNICHSLLLDSFPCWLVFLLPFPFFSSIDMGSGEYVCYIRYHGNLGVLLYQ